MAERAPPAFVGHDKGRQTQREQPLAKGATAIEDGPEDSCATFRLLAQK